MNKKNNNSLNKYYVEQWSYDNVIIANANINFITKGKEYRVASRPDDPYLPQGVYVKNDKGVIESYPDSLFDLKPIFHILITKDSIRVYDINKKGIIFWCNTLNSEKAAESLTQAVRMFHQRKQNELITLSDDDIALK